MARYRQTVFYVDAVQITAEALAAHVFDGAPLPIGVILASYSRDDQTREVVNPTVMLETPAGWQQFDVGDWVITNAASARYTVKPADFATAFEPAA